jgi:tetratricopeptide (TPR) repeat protein
MKSMKASAMQGFVHKNFGFSSAFYGKLARFIEAGTGNCNSHARMGIFLLRLAGVPAKFAWESHLALSSDEVEERAKKDGRWISGYYTSGHVWVLYWDGESWIPYDSAFGYTGYDGFLKYRWEGVDYQETRPPFVIWENTGWGFDDMKNITKSVWERYKLKNHHRVTQGDWMDFISLFAGMEVEDTRESLNEQTLTDMDRIARSFFEFKKVSRNEFSPSVRKYLEKQQHLQKDEENYYFSSFEIRILGYQRLMDEKVNDAIEVFQWYVKLFPKYAWAYGLLGEAYAVKGNMPLAKENTKKAIALNPYNRYFQMELENLEKKGTLTLHNQHINLKRRTCGLSSMPSCQDG